MNTVIEQPQTKPATVGYFERPEINCSGLKLILQSPAHFKHAQTAPRVETKAMQIGTAVHALTLEPVKFAQDYTVLLDDIDKRTKAGKEAWAALETQNKILLTRDEFEQVKNISEAVKTHPTAEKILEFGFAELEIYTQIQGVPAKAKMDWYRKGIIADLKTTEDSSPRWFCQSVCQIRLCDAGGLVLGLCQCTRHGSERIHFYRGGKVRSVLRGNLHAR